MKNIHELYPPKTRINKPLDVIDGQVNTFFLILSDKEEYVHVSRTEPSSGSVMYGFGALTEAIVVYKVDDKITELIVRPAQSSFYDELTPNELAGGFMGQPPHPEMDDASKQRAVALNLKMHEDRQRMLKRHQRIIQDLFSYLSTNNEAGMTYTDPIEWTFSGTPMQFGNAVAILSDRDSEWLIQVTRQNGGRVHVFFRNLEKEQEDWQGWAVAYHRPIGTIVSLHAPNFAYKSRSASLWERIIKELRRQGWVIEEWHQENAGTKQKEVTATQRTKDLQEMTQLHQNLLRQYEEKRAVEDDPRRLLEIDRNITREKATLSSLESELAAIGSLSLASTLATSPASTYLNETDTKNSVINLAQLNERLRATYNLGELKDLCVALNVDFEMLTGESKADKTRELTLYLQRRGSLEKLLHLVKQQRPNVSWPDTVNG